MTEPVHMATSSPADLSSISEILLVVKNGSEMRSAMSFGITAPLLVAQTQG